MYDDSVEEGYLLCSHAGFVDNGVTLMPNVDTLVIYLQTGEVVYAED
jgi:hypothetical protein